MFLIIFCVNFLGKVQFGAHEIKHSVSFVEKYFEQFERLESFINNK